MRPIAPLPDEPARGTEAEARDNENMPARRLARLRGMVVGAHLCLDEQLVAATRVAREHFTQWSERYEPQAGRNGADRPGRILAGVVAAHHEQTRVAAVRLTHQLRVAGQLADRSQRETVHRLRSVK